MNYLKELNAFREFLLEHELPAGAISLWHALMSINNKTRWKRQFNGPGAVVGQLAGLSKQGVVDARAKLVEHGLIRYEKGCPGKAPVYEMISLVQEQEQKVEVDHAAENTIKEAAIPMAHDHATTISHFMELLSDMLLPFAGNGTSENQDPVMEKLPDAVDEETRIPRKETQSINRMDSHLRTRKQSNTEQESLFKENQESRLDVIFPSGNFRRNMLHPLLDSALDQSADKSLTIHKRKQNKTKERQDRTTNAQIFSIYRDNIGNPSKLVQAELNGWIQKTGEDIVLEAIKRTAKHGGKTFSYVEKILLEWEAEGIRTVEACYRYQKQHDGRRRSDSNPGKQRSQNKADAWTLFDELREEAEV